MAKHDDSIALQHMLDHACEAVAMIEGKTRDNLDSERMLELSLVRLVEIIGEAANRVSRKGKAKYPAVPWQEIVSMRNRLIHGYDSIDLDVLWDTVKLELPPLILELKKV